LTLRPQVVHVGDEVVATTRCHDDAHRPLSVWAQCLPLEVKELFLLSGPNPVWFNSRDFGSFDASTLGIAIDVHVGRAMRCARADA